MKTRRKNRYREANRLLRADCIWLDANGKIVWDSERAIEILHEVFDQKEQRNE